jgi:hypothetical protein
MQSSTLAAVVAATTLALAGCAGGDQPDANQALSQLAKAATQLAEQAQQAAGGAAGALSKDAKPVPPVSFRALIDYLPKELGGMTASEPDGETTKAGEWQYSQASVRFTGGQGQGAEATISDFAHISMLYLPFQMALKMKVSQESTKGYSRSIEFGGYPALEEWNRDDKRSELTVLVGDRFVVSAKMRGGEEGAARGIVEKMDLAGLAREGAN